MRQWDPLPFICVLFNSLASLEFFVWNFLWWFRCALCPWKAFSLPSFSMFRKNKGKIGPRRSERKVCGVDVWPFYKAYGQSDMRRKNKTSLWVLISYTRGFFQLQRGFWSRGILQGLFVSFTHKDWLAAFCKGHCYQFPFILQDSFSYYCTILSNGNSSF